MNWIIPSILIISVAFFLEDLMTGLGSGFLACLGYILWEANKALTVDEE